MGTPFLSFYNKKMGNPGPIGTLVEEQLIYDI